MSLHWNGSAQASTPTTLPATTPIHPQAPSAAPAPGCAGATPAVRLAGLRYRWPGAAADCLAIDALTIGAGERVFLRGVPEVRDHGLVLGFDGLHLELPVGSTDIRQHELD